MSALLVWVAVGAIGCGEGEPRANQAPETPTVTTTSGGEANGGSSSGSSGGA
jgi:hypothetical protein